MTNREFLDQYIQNIYTTVSEQKAFKFGIAAAWLRAEIARGWKAGEYTLESPICRASEVESATAGCVDAVIAEMKRSPLYFMYINSPRWTERRQEYFSTHDKRCDLCGSEENIHLHHLSYENLGDEPDEDLQPLCGNCHKEVHGE